MKPSHPSDGLLPRLSAIFVALVITGFLVPRGALNNDQLLLLWIIIPVLGWVWIQTSIDAARDH